MQALLELKVLVVVVVVVVGGRGLDNLPDLPGPTGRLRGRVEAADAGTTTALAARDIAAALDLAGAYAEVSMRRRSQETIQLTTVVAR